ncbi:MAG: TerC family protein [Phycisphaerales bacterium]|nr:TerC family protein [Phycisphaerales bacterium]
MLALDLGVFHRKAHEVRFKEALTWSVVWVALALLFNFGILQGWFGPYLPEERSLRAKEFLVGYLVEKSLSIDNVFVFAMVFAYFSVPAAYQHRVLFYGIIGALLMRAVFIFAGSWLIQHFEWVLYFFAAFLVVTGIKMIWAKGKQIEPDKNPVIRLARRMLPITPEYHGQYFFRRIDGRLVATPLFLVLLFIETTDVIFAIDSIPAILIITQDTFIVYTSNVFAILGLRALYFALAGFMKMFHMLTYGLAGVLVFIGGKMFYQAAVKALWQLDHDVKVPIGLSLGVIAAIIAMSVVASLLFPEKKSTRGATPA